MHHANDPRARRRSTAARRAAVALAAVACLAVVAGCGSDDDESIGEATTTTEAAEATTTTTPVGREDDGAEDGGGEDATTTTAADEVDGGTDVVGTWTADASEILASNTANVGGAGGLSCSGPVTLDFKANGTFAQSAEATCTGPGGLSATATIASSGTYEVAGSQLRVLSAENQGTISVMGTTQDLPAGLDVGPPADVAVDGDTLTITFTQESVGTVSQTYTRA